MPILLFDRLNGTDRVGTSVRLEMIIQSRSSSVTNEKSTTVSYSFDTSAYGLLNIAIISIADK